MNRKSRVLIGSLAALGAIAAAPVGTALASPSSAAAVHSPARAEISAGSYTSCPNGYFCMWTEANFNGTMYKFNSDTPTLPSGIINNDASLVDMSITPVRLWYGPNEGNPHTCVPGVTGEGPDSVAPNLLTPVHYYFNSNETGTREYVYDNVHGITFATDGCSTDMFTER